MYMYMYYASPCAINTLCLREQGREEGEREREKGRERGRERDRNVLHVLLVNISF